MKYLIVFVLSLFLATGCTRISELPYMEEDAPNILMMQYLTKELSPEDYSNYIGIDENTIKIWCINRENVEKTVSEYKQSKGKDITVLYDVAKYPLSVLLPLFQEIPELPIIIDNMEQIYSISVTGGGLEIIIIDKDSFPQIFKWLATYEHKEYVLIRDISEFNNLSQLTEQTEISKVEPNNSPDSQTNGFSQEEKEQTHSDSQNTPPDVLPNHQANVLSEEEIREKLLTELCQYLEDALSPDDYASVIKYNQNTVTIYCINEENVRLIVEEFRSHSLEIQYIPAKYSLSELTPILDELMELNLPSGLARENGIEIVLIKDSESYKNLRAWFDSNPEKEKYFYIFEVNDINLVPN